METKGRVGLVFRVGMTFLCLALFQEAIALPLGSADRIRRAKQYIESYQFKSSRGEYNGSEGTDIYRIEGANRDPDLEVVFGPNGKIEKVHFFSTASMKNLDLGGRSMFTESEVILSLEEAIARWEDNSGKVIGPQTRRPRKNARRPVKALQQLLTVKPEIGNPVYVIEQAKKGLIADKGFSFFEVTGNTYRPLLRFTEHQLQVNAYGLSGFQMNDDGTIRPGMLFVLDDQQTLWKTNSELGSELSSLRLKPLPGKFVLLENQAEATLFALNENQSIVELFPDGETKLVAALPSKGLELHRSPENHLRVATEKDGLLEWNPNSKRFEKLSDFPANFDADTFISARYYGRALWIAQNNTLLRLDLATGQTQSAHLEKLIETTQGGKEFQFLGTENGHVYARVGNHFFAFSPSETGRSLTSRFVTESYFSTTLRSLGVTNRLGSRTHIIQPRIADRTGEYFIKQKKLSALLAAKAAECAKIVDPNTNPEPLKK